MATWDYLFVDETGDPGDGSGGSSDYYGMSLLHITDDVFDRVLEHLTNLRYHRGLTRELRLKPVKRKGGVWEFGKLLDGIKALASQEAVFASSVYLVKDQYTGPYLKDSSPRGKNPIWFRNFVLRHLLEFHFAECKPRTQQIDLVIDRFELSRDGRINLEEYIQNNYNLPPIKHITHAASLYVEVLQAVHHLSTVLKVLATGEAPPDLLELLSFVRLKDITSL